MTEPQTPGEGAAWTPGPWQQPTGAPPQAAPYWGPQAGVGVVDPTNVVGRRVGAAIIDTVILAIPQALIFVTLMWQPLFGAGGFIDQIERASRSRSAPAPAMTGQFLMSYLLAIASMWAVMFLYYFITERVFEGSPGKLIFGLRVVGRTGVAPITWGQSAGRNALRLLFDSSFVALIVILVSKGHRRVGDMAAHTLVIDKGYVGRFAEIYPPAGIPPWEPATTSQPYVAPPMPGAL